MPQVYPTSELTVVVSLPSSPPASCVGINGSSESGASCIALVAGSANPASSYSHTVAMRKSRTQNRISLLAGVRQEAHERLNRTGAGDDLGALRALHRFLRVNDFASYGAIIP